MTPWYKSLRCCKWPPTVRSQFGDLDFQGGDLLARSLGSDPPLLAAPGQVGKAVLVLRRPESRSGFQPDELAPSGWKA